MRARSHSARRISRPELTEELQRLAIQAWRVVGGEGYGRVDFRIDRAGKPWILEVNSNPDLAPDAGLARMARVEGLDYGALVRAICERGVRRERPTTSDQWALARRLSGVAVSGEGEVLELFAVGQR